MESEFQSLTHLLKHVFKAHPWHGISIGDQAPDVITCYIEIVPTDTVKFELDKDTGHLSVDRPQRFSNVCPTLYGLVPHTYCGDTVARICNEATGRTDIVGDADPLDVCVLSEKTFGHGDIILKAKPIGGLRMIDDNEADDKIIAVMEGDAAYGDWTDIDDCPSTVIERLRHYFLTYKDVPRVNPKQCEITHIYGAAEARTIIQKSQEDYARKFPQLEDMLNLALGGHRPE